MITREEAVEKIRTESAKSEIERLRDRALELSSAQREIEAHEVLSVLIDVLDELYSRGKS